MWFLATRGRPDQCVELIEAFEKTGDIPEVAVMIDDDPDVYKEVPWPDKWHIHHSPEHWEMTRSINELYLLYPGHKCYGFFGDHYRPLTPMWKQLEDAAGDWFIAWPNDDYMSKEEFAGAPTFGTKLLREVGWICLPTTIHIATEAPWMLLWYKLGIVKHLEQHKFTRSWPNRKEGIVKRNYKGVDYNQADFEAWHHWRNTEARELIDRIREKMKADGYTFDHEGIIDQKYGCAPYIKVQKTKPIRYMDLMNAR